MEYYILVFIYRSYEKDVILKSDKAFNILILQSSHISLYLFALRMILPPMSVTKFEMLQCVEVLQGLTTIGADCMHIAISLL